MDHPKDRRDEDEWVRVGRVLGDKWGVLAANTRLGRVLRQAVVVASLPDASERELDAIRELTEALEEFAARQARDGDSG